MRYIWLSLLALAVTAPPARAACGFLNDQPAENHYAKTSPDHRFTVVKDICGNTSDKAELRDRSGHKLADIPGLLDDDAMPVTVVWSADSRWFFANHHIGSFMDRLQVFQIVGGKAVERPALFTAAARLAHRRYPCLTTRAVTGDGMGWTRDNRHIALFTTASPDACLDFDAPGEPETGVFRDLVMIGDVRSGRIDPASVRVFAVPAKLPHDGPYAAVIPAKAW